VADLSHVDTSALADEARATPGLELLLLFGSRARGNAVAASDWDFGYLASPALDVASLLAALVTRLGTDRIDVVDLRRASGLLRYRAARDGRLIFESRHGLVDRFRLDAAQFWCEAARILERGYERVLAELER
jgi:predicted nucleotidyltransferase